MKVYYRGYECNLEDGVLTHKGHIQLISCCYCKQVMSIDTQRNGKVYLTCEPCREELKEKRLAKRARPRFIPDDDENDINNYEDNNNNNV